MKTNTPNPLVPQGTFSDPKAKSNLRMTVFLIIAGHIVLISGLLMAGCKKTAEPQPGDQGLITSSFDTNTLPPLTNNPDPVMTTATSNPPPSTEPSNPVPPVVMNDVVAPPPPPPVANEGEREHTIVAKDSFYTLAKKYGVSTKAIELANPGVDSKRLKIGQKIKIPAPSPKAPAVSTVATEGAERIYVVKSGDRLFTIAKANNISVKELKAANNLRLDRITVGQKLKIPAKAAPAPAAIPESAPAPVPVPMTPISAPAPAPTNP